MQDTYWGNSFLVNSGDIVFDDGDGTNIYVTIQENSDAFISTESLKYLYKLYILLVMIG